LSNCAKNVNRSIEACLSDLENLESYENISSNREQGRSSGKPPSKKRKAVRRQLFPALTKKSPFVEDEAMAEGNFTD